MSSYGGAGAGRPVKFAAPKRPKRKCMTLSLGEKLRLLEKIDAGGRLRNLMAEFGISKTTFYDIQRDKDKLRAYARYQEDPEVVHRKRITSAKYEAMELTLYEWYKRKRDALIKVRGIDVQAAAESLAPQLGITEFKASYGWLRNFQDRYGIKKRKVPRGEEEPPAAEDTAAAPPYPVPATHTPASRWVDPADVETVLYEDEGHEDNSNPASCANEDLLVTTVDGRPIKDEVVEWMDEDLEVSDGVSSVEGEIKKLQHLPLDSLPIQIKNISGSQIRARGPAAGGKDQSTPRTTNHDKDPSSQTHHHQTPETTSPHNMTRFSTVPDHAQDEEEELFGRYIAAAIRKLSSRSKSLAKMRIQKVLFHLEQQSSNRESAECKLDKGSETDQTKHETA